MKMFSQVFCEFSNENNYTVYMHMRVENNCCRWFYMCEWSCNLFQPIPWTKELCLKDMTEEKMILKIITRISGFTPNCLWLEWSCLEFQIDLTSNDSLTIHPFFLINAVNGQILKNVYQPYPCGISLMNFWLYSFEALMK